MSGFRRLVLELGHGAADPATLRQAAVFAALLDAELHALFVEDEALLNASALPFAREISPLSYRWRKLEPERLRDELRANAEQVRGRLLDAANASGVRRNFTVTRGDVDVLINETCVASDIVVVALSAGSAITHGFQRLLETADRSAASVLYLPPRPGPRRGPIAVARGGNDDPALAVARVIAARAHERLLEVAGDIVTTIGNARLLILTRSSAAGESGEELAAALRVPVLLLEAAVTRAA